MLQSFTKLGQPCQHAPQAQKFEVYAYLTTKLKFLKTIVKNSHGKAATSSSGFIENSATSEVASAGRPVLLQSNSSIFPRPIRCNFLGPYDTKNYKIFSICPLKCADVLHFSATYKTGPLMADGSDHSILTGLAMARLAISSPASSLKFSRFKRLMGSRQYLNKIFCLKIT